MALIPSGRMRHKVRLEKNEGSSRNAVGEVVSSWVEKGTLWAEIKTLSGGELEEAKQIHEAITLSLTSHFQPDITTDYRVKWNPTVGSTTTLHLEHVRNVDYENHTLIMFAREVN